jgi:hypothetical protein
MATDMMKAQAENVVVILKLYQRCRLRSDGRAATIRRQAEEIRELEREVETLEQIIYEM